MEAHYATVWEAIADAIPDEDAIVQGARRRSWGEFESRAARLAGAFEEVGVGRDSKVALYLYNSAEYMEGWFAALKLRAIPVNVNYRYLDDELQYLLENSDSEVVVFHSSLGERVARVRDRLPLVKRWIEVADDMNGANAVTAEMNAAHVAGADRYEDVLASSVAAARIERSPHDIGMTYTGGTTGMPKGVMAELGGGVTGALAALPPLVGMPPVRVVDEMRELPTTLVALDKRVRTIVACPLMHGTGIGIGATPTLTFAGCIYLLEHRKFDPHEVWDTVEAERIHGVVVVGDPFARPLARALDDRPGRDLSSMILIASAGAMFSREVKEALVEHIPQLLIVDYMASTEGAMATSIYSAHSQTATAKFTINPEVKVFTEDDREVEPGSGVVGVLAVAGGPLGYYKDAEKSARTFRVVDGVRYSFPGDYATIDADGTITLLGRGSQVINTGGEKVFAEEVEEALKTHESIEDALVVGVPDERFGNRIVAVVSTRDGSSSVDEAAVIAHMKSKLAAYKAPKSVVVVAVVPRSPNGKADYASAREAALTTVL